MEHGNLRTDVKVEIQVEALQGSRTEAVRRGGLTRSSVETAERQWSEGVKLSVLWFSQPMKIGRS